jgi:hypothetical protein
MPDDLVALSRREWFVCVATLILGTCRPTPIPPQLRTKHLEVAERQFWESLLCDVSQSLSDSGRAIGQTVDLVRPGRSEGKNQAN